MTLQTRPPTGQAGYPNLIVEGREGAGKTFASLTFTADPRIGAAYVVEVGERRVDEYAALGNFQVVVHDGRLQTIVPAMLDVMAIPPVDGKPTLLIVDSGTGWWDLVKREAERIAKSSRAAREKLANDPDAEIEVGHQAWNKAKDRWWHSVVDTARAWPGILLITARADEVSKFVDGKPVANQTVYRVDIEGGTPYVVDGTVRMRQGHPPLLTTVKSLKIPQLPDGGIELPTEAPLAHLIFDMLGAGEQVTLNAAQAKQALIAHARILGLSAVDAEDGTPSPAKRAAAAAWTKAVEDPAAFVGDGPTMSRLVDAVEVEVAALSPQEAQGGSGGTEHTPEGAGGPEAPAGAGISDLLSRRLHALLRKKRGVADAARFPVLTELAGRPITSSKQLTQDEAIAICDVLAAEPDLPEGTPTTKEAPPAEPEGEEPSGGGYVAEDEHEIPDAEADEIIGAIIVAVLDLTPIQVQAQLMERHEAPPATEDDQRRRLVVLQAADQLVTEDQVDRFYAEAGA